MTNLSGRWRIALICLVLSGARWVGAEEARPSVEVPAGVELRENLVYGRGGDRDLTLHFARPKENGERLPLIVFVHGGGWRGGKKELHLPHIVDAAQRGYAAATVGYRLVPEARFPSQVEDVKCAIRYLRAHADELKIRPDRIGAIGFSAGAHLVMLLGTLDPPDGLDGSGGWPEQSSKVQAVVAYFGPTNFVGSEYPSTSRQLVRDFLGGTEEEQPENYRRASPVSYASRGDAPTLIFQGTADILVPYRQAFEMVDALTKVGVKGRAEMMFGAGHGWGPEETARTTAVGYAFFAEHLRAE